jgi:class 3 adenylate cyclase
MTMSARTVQDLVARHLAEASAGTVECNVSELNRGEATLRRYYMLKTDLVGSTMVLQNEPNDVYLKLAHAYLSSVDRITQEYGAQRDQTEYAGDSVIAFFPVHGNTALGTLVAACFSHYAARVLRKSDSQMARLGLQTRTVLHYGELLVAVIGPHGESHRVAIGLPMHEVGHREKSPCVPIDGIYVTEEFAAQLPSKVRDGLLTQVWRTERRASGIPSLPPKPQSIRALSLAGILNPSALTPLGDAFTPGALSQVEGTGRDGEGARLSDLMSYSPSEALGIGGLSGVAALSGIPSDRPKTLHERHAEKMYGSKPIQTEVRVHDGFTVDMKKAYADLGL